MNPILMMKVPTMLKLLKMLQILFELTIPYEGLTLMTVHGTIVRFEVQIRIL